MTMSTNMSPERAAHLAEQFRTMARAWEAKDWRTCADLFLPDGVLHSVMLEPVVGREAIHSRLVSRAAPNKEVRLHIRRIGVVADALFVEREDEVILDGVSRSAPAVGVLTFEGSHIRLWREYYDRAQLMHAAGHGPAPAYS